ncbi:MAG: isoaspartyl peptidase/L-asparaginase family protein [Fidelibacterota bacterium]
MTLSCSKSKSNETPFGLVIHGGAGTIRRENLTPELESQIRTKLQEALDAGYAALKEGRSSLDAVVATITILEDSPLFNAGKGAVFTHDGGHELDASLMTGENREAGAVAGTRRVKNPILLARKILEESPHVILSGNGADEFAREKGLELVEPSYYDTPRRRKALDRILDQAKKDKYGTVGCVALDKDGNLAAGTSTGGMTNKSFGRIGDSPIVGAGTYADNRTCAVSCTGHGEYFIRAAVAYDVSARMAYLGESVEQASENIIYHTLKDFGGNGGLIALDRQGNFAMPFNTPGMYRGFLMSDGRAGVKIFADE